ncbi:MAG: membrane protein insertion efficiency factor YidD [Alphaproteobacteria bacterium]|nr:membrane protein insertion efficiency factor YidD [Alphaproteobacteria bacterium]
MIKSLIKAYRFLISPLFGGTCRFHPTCSAYALEAIETHGQVKGVWLSVRRLLRCHPWHQGDYLDPVPPCGDLCLRHKSTKID